ncbi:MAG: 3-isopropylmalate dehydrogenase [Devosia sp. 67-54]|uniref:LOG family protein n=1 Tax=unclassified Devosia TaxID=196773 RepID=UPI000962D918|nr:MULTISPECIES: LOG family protein [unclassified Devosia]MBN9304475.1 LOG family protein [Devosia sp.]OJX15523.1 MAG: 3-isopropylmalate dehydrogenase [Devosia sp. 67-54]
MASRRRAAHTPLRTSKQDIAALKRAPQTPQTASAAYRLAYTDEEFITSDDTRGIRFQLEYLKPELRLQQRGITSTVVLFGGARIPEPGKPAWAARNEVQKKNLELASKYYDEARRFAQYASLTSEALGYKEYVVVTGGGPGVMEAGNRGAADVGAPSIGFNIVLPHEQAPNTFITPELCFNFHYFATRKIHFLLRAKAVAIFPGGFGTLDEFFETLTLIQTGRMERVPLLLFGIEFWNNVINFDALAQAGTISPEDPKLFTVVDSAEDGWSVVRDFYKLPKVELR